MLDPVKVVVVVNATQSRAFAGFTDKMTAWWPLDTHSISGSRQNAVAPMVTVDPREGGQIVEQCADGSTAVWGQITVWDAPRRVDFAWFVGRGPEQATHVSVWFDPVDDGKTAVTLVHSNWEVLGDEAKTQRDQYDGGWAALIGQMYVPFVEGMAD